MNFRSLDLNLLRVFDVVMVERNVTRAAARLSMTQPAVSNALRRLRESTREDLFVRAAAGVAPTPHAEALWPAVRRALAELRDAFEPQRFDARTEARGFTLAMAEATAALLVPVLVDAIERDRLAVDLCFLPLASRDPRALLEHGQADLAVGFFPEVAAALAAEGDAALTRLEPLYDADYVCAMRADHPLAADGALTLDAYCAAQHLRVSFAGRPRGWVDEELARLGRSRRIVVTVGHHSTAGSAVQRSDLLTVLPRRFVRASGFAGQLAVRPLPFELPDIAVALLWHGRHERDPAQRWLRETVGRAAGQVAAGG